MTIKGSVVYSIYTMRRPWLTTETMDIIDQYIYGSWFKRLDPGLNEKIFTDTARSAMMDTPGKN